MAAQDNQVPEASTGSSPSKVSNKSRPAEPTRSAVGTSFQMRTEIPALPTGLQQAYARTETDDKSAGNFEFTTELLERGLIGYWRKRQDTCEEPTPIYVHAESYFLGIRGTIQGVLKRLFYLKTQLPDGTVLERIESTATTLACGCCLMTYLKIRNIITSELPMLHTQSNLRRPRAKEALALPQGFAFAIQQLGLVNVADSLKERIYAPAYPSEGHTSGIPTAYNNLWNPNAYATAVEYARSLGMRFSVVDLTKKTGTAWWLFRQSYQDGVFELQCTIPEVNFTKAMAVTHAMFIDGDELNPSRPLFDIQPLGDTNFGIMLRNPHSGIHLSCYEAIAQEANEVVSNV